MLFLYFTAAIFFHIFIFISFVFLISTLGYLLIYRVGSFLFLILFFLFFLRVFTVSSSLDFFTFFLLYLLPTSSSLHTISSSFFVFRLFLWIFFSILFYDPSVGYFFIFLSSFPLILSGYSLKL